ncbi:hypothetical protein D6C84_04044 [Aureobasidium pullulans]|uniref:Uncharacterized protein n=1 Tax=Aureobasidium pullulans TaxID=5580 RepID=A0A4V6TJD6_AURPU|nr:hypothetical protein D6C84_04044 [Aureobasidium pullulans]
MGEWSTSITVGFLQVASIASVALTEVYIAFEYGRQQKMLRLYIVLSLDSFCSSRYLAGGHCKPQAPWSLALHIVEATTSGASPTSVPADELVSYDHVNESLGATHKVYDKQGASGFDEDVEASPEVQAAIEGNWTDLFKGRTTPRPDDVGPDKMRFSKQRPEASPVFQC